MLGRKQEDTIAALLTQRNIEEAAKAAGISAPHVVALVETSGVPNGLPGSPPDGIFPSGHQAPAGSHCRGNDPAQK
jgi:hypothetical protein